MKMKLKKFSPVRQDADALGEKYEAYRSAESAAAEGKELTAAKIKALAQRFGEKDGNRTVLQGQFYCVGFTNTEPDPIPDLELCRRILPASVFKKVTSLVIDKTAFLKAVEDGLIPNKVLLKVVVPAQSQQRLLVKRNK